MACNTLIAITKECTSNLGGVKEVWFLPLENVLTLLYEDYVVTEISTDLPFVKYEVPLNSAVYNVNYTIDDLGVQEFSHSLSIRISRRRPTAHVALNAFIEGNPDLVALVKDANNYWWLLGYENGLNSNSGGGSSGTNKVDGSFYTFELSSVERTFEIRVPDEVVTSLIGGGSSL